MPILGQVEAKSWRGRVLHGSIIIALALGGATMIYPFLIMISGSLRSNMDANDFTVVPTYLVNDDALYQKFLETKYNGNLGLLGEARIEQHYQFKDIAPPENYLDDAQAVLALLQSDLPRHWQNLGGLQGDRTVPEKLREYRERLYERFDGDIDELGKNAGAPFTGWNNVNFITPTWSSDLFEYQPNAGYETYFDMMGESEPADRYLISLTGAFIRTILYPAYTSSSVDLYNEAHKNKIESYRDFKLPQAVPGEDQPKLREEWIEFVQEEVNPSFVLVEGATQADYDAFQRSIGIDGLLALPQGEWLSGQARLVYEQFLDSRPIEDLRLTGPDFAVGPGVSIGDGLAQLEYEYVLAHAGQLRWDYAIRNYVTVMNELVFQGRALFNTVVYCVVSIGLALFFNPLAAFAMSRFKLKGTYKILLFLMATMSFPPMVTLIPQYLLLRNLGLMNTYAALVLPMIANGYMVFLLKGFFDSLPQELYEAARIDGASETRMFFQITMSLSKPILAVLALGTFTGAYTAFLYPLLVAPDPDMWLISVWLYQFQARSSSGAVYASVLVASIPTLVIFLFAQRTIMRGIVVPTEK